jgi:hypothetical protein
MPFSAFHTGFRASSRYIKRTIKSTISLILDNSVCNLNQLFPAYSPYSAGSYRATSKLTIKAINEFHSAILSIPLIPSCFPSELDVSDFLADASCEESESLLAQHFSTNGSDKSTRHKYHIVYARILSRLPSNPRLFEIGLGTSDTSIVSTMGRHSRPGASLYSFKQFRPSAYVYGGDIDTKILFQDGGICTTFVDQLNTTSITQALAKFGNTYDMIIDDGLHSPLANINVISASASCLTNGGWIVIEDINPEARNIWRLVAQLMGDSFECYIIDDSQSTTHSLLFAAFKK